MRVTQVTTCLLRGTDPHGIGGQPRERSIRLIRIETDAGLTGIGEATELIGVVEAIRYCASWLVGRDPLDVSVFIRAMFYGGLPPARPWISPTGTVTGPIAWAVSGVEMALLDLKGKALGAPAYSLLGGCFRRDVPVYLDRSGAAGPFDKDGGAWRNLVERSIDEGFGDFKLDLEWIAPELTADPWARSMPLHQVDLVAKRLADVRAWAGPEATIALDGHMLFDATTAIELARGVESVRPRWLEDPVPLLNMDALADVRRHSPIPICTGESLVAEQFVSLLSRGACDIVHPDVLHTGGMLEMFRIGQMADHAYLPMAIHNDGAAVATIAAAHVAAATPNFLGLEYHFYDAPWMAAIVEREGGLFSAGHVTLDEAPGLGIELNMHVMEDHATSGWVA